MINNEIKNIIGSKGGLSTRESEVLVLIIMGFTSKQIAEKLRISLETVRTHRKHILKKTLAKNTASLCRQYYGNSKIKLKLKTDLIAVKNPPKG